MLCLLLVLSSGSRKRCPLASLDPLLGLFFFFFSLCKWEESVFLSPKGFRKVESIQTILALLNLGDVLLFLMDSKGLGPVRAQIRSLDRG